jgi:hypothetical protein
MGYVEHPVTAHLWDYRDGDAMVVVDCLSKINRRLLTCSYGKQIHSMTQHDWCVRKMPLKHALK